MLSIELREALPLFPGLAVLGFAISSIVENSFLFGKVELNGAYELGVA